MDKIRQGLIRIFGLTALGASILGLVLLVYLFIFALAHDLFGVLLPPPWVVIIVGAFAWAWWTWRSGWWRQIGD
jgi:hypothetical protein